MTGTTTEETKENLTWRIEVAGPQATTRSFTVEAPTRELAVAEARNQGFEPLPGGVRLY